MLRNVILTRVSNINLVTACSTRYLPAVLGVIMQYKMNHFHWNYT